MNLAARLADRPIAASTAALVLTARLARDASQWEPDDLSPAAENLRAEGTRSAALLGLAVLAAAGPRSGWSSIWRDRLRTIRRAPDPDVRAAALPPSPVRSDHREPKDAA